MTTERDKQAMACQICGRPICANTGLIAHHGYQRPHLQGWQTQSCFGARKRPYEYQREALGEYIEMVERELHRLREMLKAVQQDRQAVGVEWVEYKGMAKANHFVEVTASTFADVRAAHEGAFIRIGARSFEECKRREVIQREGKIRGLEQEKEEQSKRYRAWNLTHMWVGGRWVATTTAKAK